MLFANVHFRILTTDTGDTWQLYNDTVLGSLCVTKSIHIAPPKSAVLLVNVTFESDIVSKLPAFFALYIYAHGGNSA